MGPFQHIGEVDSLIVKVLLGYCSRPELPHKLSVLSKVTSLGEEELRSFVAYLEEHKLVAITPRETITCSEHRLQGTVENLEEGICRCDRGHSFAVDPMELKEARVDELKVAEWVTEQLGERGGIPGPPDTVRSYLPSDKLGFYRLGEHSYNDIRVSMHMALKPIELEEACLLQGLFLTSSDDLMFLFTNPTLVSDEAKELLAFNLPFAIYIRSLQKVIETPEDIPLDLEATINDVGTSTFKLASWLRNKLRSVSHIRTPGEFHSIVSYSDRLVNDGKYAATHGQITTFQRIVAGQFQSIFPTTETAEVGKEIFDGIVQLVSPLSPGGGNKVMFYDAKSCGKEEKESLVRKLSKSDEDEFVRYCLLLRNEKIPVELYAGSFVANDFSISNMITRARNLRKRSNEVPGDMRIVFFPLESLVRLYEIATTKRGVFLQKFETSHIPKLFGEGLDPDEVSRLETGPRSEHYKKLRDADLNAVLVLPELCDIFFENVRSAVGRDEKFMVYL